VALHDFLLTALAFLSELVGTVSGFGSSTFFVPLATFLEPFQLVLALTGILHCLGNFSRILLFRHAFSRELLLRLGLPSVALTALGALLSTQVSAGYLTKFLGAALVLIGLAKLLLRRWPLAPSISRATVLCGISGMMTGLVGTGGAIRGIALSGLQIEKHSFVALSAAIDVGGDVLRTGIYLYEGYMDWSQWFYIPLLGVAAAAGTYAGKQVLGLIRQQYFEKAVALFVLLSGLAMIMER